MIIAISGKIGAGKDTVTDMIIREYPMFQRRAFATRVKQVVATLTNTTLEQNIDRQGKSYVPPGFTDSLARLQQKIGEDFKSLFSQDIWIRCLLENGLSEYTIITDCRFQIEADAIKKKGGIIIRIDGDPADIRKLNKENRDLNHQSEIDLDDYIGFDYHINNSELSMYELEKQVLSIMKVCILVI